MEKNKIPNYILVAFVALGLIHLLMSKGQGMFGYMVLYFVPVSAVLMVLAAIAYPISLFVCFKPEERKKIFIVLSVLMVLFSAAPSILGVHYAMDLANGTVMKETEYYTLGDRCIYLNEKEATIYIELSNSQVKYMKANEPPKNMRKMKYLDSGTSIYAHEEKASVEYYVRTGIAKKVSYIRNK